jgi:ABC-type transport system substrate-binding protein
MVCTLPRSHRPAYEILDDGKRWEEVGGPEQHKLRPIGTGPYQLVDWKVGVEQQWVKHPQYWRGEPMADRVNIKIISENRARLAALQTGEVQVAWLQAEQVPEAQKDPNLKVWSFTGVGWDGWAWATGLPPLDALRMRRALVKAVDRDALNKAIYLNTLRPSQAHTFPPGSPYGINAQELWEGDWLKYDVAAAKKSVREREFIVAVAGMGAHPWRIMLKHLIPNSGGRTDNRWSAPPHIAAAPRPTHPSDACRVALAASEP